MNVPCQFLAGFAVANQVGPSVVTTADPSVMLGAEVVAGVAWLMSIPKAPIATRAIAALVPATARRRLMASALHTPLFCNAAKLPQRYSKFACDVKEKCEVDIRLDSSRICA